MFKINIYLEVSISGVKAKKGWYGYVVDWVDDNGESKAPDRNPTEFISVDNPTKNQLVLMAMINALQRMTRGSEITVYTDSLYLSGNFENNMKAWKRAEWKKSNGEPVKNADLWTVLERLAQPHLITFSKDYSHSYKNWMVAELEKRRTGNA